MAMNKKEKARMAELERELAKVKALRFPDYPAPEKIYTSDKDNLVSGWTTYNNRTDYGVKFFSKKNITHYPEILYATEVDALKVARIGLTHEFAKVLADLDEKIGNLE